jgi:hypothetical protein
MFDKSPFSRSPTHQSSSSSTPFPNEDIDGTPFDPSLRLRTVTTAHSAITESIANEARQDAARQKRRRLFGTLKRRGSRATKTRSGTLLPITGTFSRKSSWGGGSRGSSGGGIKEEELGDDNIPLQVITRDGPSEMGRVTFKQQDGGSVTIPESSSSSLVAGTSTAALLDTSLSPSSSTSATKKDKKSVKAQGKQRTIYINLVRLDLI